MSQHLYTTTLQGRPVRILSGWDRPLRGHFFVVERLDGDDCEYLYSNLDDPRLVECNGLPCSMDYFVSKLAELGLQMPDAMLREILRDAAGNVGNRVVDHTAEGKV